MDVTRESNSICWRAPAALINTPFGTLPLTPWSIGSAKPTGGSKYPDHLEFTGAGGAPLLLSRRAADAFRENGITGIEETVPVQTVRESGPLPEGAPEYVLARVRGRIELDLPKMGLKKKKLCRVCGGFEWNRQRLSPLLLDASTWDGSDLCRIDSIPGYVICTDRVVALVKKQKLKGFSFWAL